MLCSGLVNGHCIFSAGEREQIRSVSRNTVAGNVSTAVDNSLGDWLDTIHRPGDFTTDRDISADTVVDTDVQGI